MIDIQSLLRLETTMLSAVIIGIILGKRGMVDKNGRKTLTDLLINIILPFSIIGSFVDNDPSEILGNSLRGLLVSILVLIVCYILGKFIYFKSEEKHLPILQYGTMVSNVGFMGLPIIGGLYGTQGLLFASIYMIPPRVYMWTLGLRLFTKTKGEGSIKKVLTHPCIIATGIGVLLMLIPFEIPELITGTIKSLGGGTTVLSMIVIGSILSEAKLKGIITKEILYYCFVRLALIPTIALFMCKLLSFDSFITGVAVVMTAMPMGSVTAILAEKYGIDSEFASKCVSFSTGLSLLTIPLWSVVLHNILT